MWTALGLRAMSLSVRWAAGFAATVAVLSVMPGAPSVAASAQPLPAPFTQTSVPVKAEEPRSAEPLTSGSVQSAPSIDGHRRRRDRPDRLRCHRDRLRPSAPGRARETGSPRSGAAPPQGQSDVAIGRLRAQQAGKGVVLRHLKVRAVRRLAGVTSQAALASHRPASAAATQGGAPASDRSGLRACRHHGCPACALRWPS